VDSVRITGREIGKGVGLITLDKRGEFGVAHDTPHLCWAATSNGKTETGMTGTHV